MGVTLGFMHYNAKAKKEKIKPTDYDINAFERNPMRMLELSAVDSATSQPVSATFDVLDERKEKPVVLLRDKYLPRSVFKDMLTVYVTARAKGYFVKEVAVEGYDTLKIFQEIRLRKIPQSPIGVFYFDQSSSKMKGEYTSKIDSVVSILQSNSHMNIAIVGHTSADGSSRLNKTLSLKRAKVIRRLLVKSGVDEQRIAVSGVGSMQPKVVRDTEEYQSINRRVEVFLRND